MTAASSPGIHHDRADRVKVQVVGVLQLGEQPGHFPAHVAVQVADQSPLRSNVVAIVVMQRRGTPQEDHPRLAGLTNRVDRGCATDLTVAQHPLMQVEIVRHREHRKVAAQEVQELVLLTERQPAGDRMQAVCPDDKIKCLRRPVLERDVDPLLDLFK